jgi:hypothetical protein
MSSRRPAPRRAHRTRAGGGETQAPEARKIISLGREPQGKERQIEKSPGGATDSRLRRKPLPSCPDICRRSAADDGFLGGLESWGSRPRLCIYRRSAAQGTCFLGSCLEFSSLSPGESRVGADYWLLDPQKPRGPSTTATSSCPLGRHRNLMLLGARPRGLGPLRWAPRVWAE